VVRLQARLPEHGGTRLGAWLAAFVVLAVLTASAVAVASGNRHDGQTPVAPLTTTLGSTIVQIPANVPSAYLQVVGSSEERQLGIALSSHWIAYDGSTSDSVPDGQTVQWPGPLGVDGSASRLLLRLDAHAPPTVVELLSFDNEVDAQAVPRGEPDRVDCLETQGILDGCTWSFDGANIAVSSTVTRHHERSLLVLYVQWYVPRDSRPAKAASNPTISASWGFSLIAQP